MVPRVKELGAWFDNIISAGDVEMTPKNRGQLRETWRFPPPSTLKNRGPHTSRKTRAAKTAKPRTAQDAAGDGLFESELFKSSVP